MSKRAADFMDAAAVSAAVVPITLDDNRTIWWTVRGPYAEAWIRLSEGRWDWWHQDDLPVYVESLGVGDGLVGVEVVALRDRLEEISRDWAASGAAAR